MKQLDCASPSCTSSSLGISAPWAPKERGRAGGQLKKQAKVHRLDCTNVTQHQAVRPTKPSPIMLCGFGACKELQACQLTNRVRNNHKTVSRSSSNACGLNRPSMQSFSRSRGLVARAGHQPTYPSETRPGRSRGRGTSTSSHSLIRRWDYVRPSAKKQRSLQASPGISRLQGQQSHSTQPTFRAGGWENKDNWLQKARTQPDCWTALHTTVHKACVRDKEAAVATCLRDQTHHQKPQPSTRSENAAMMALPLRSPSF